MFNEHIPIRVGFDPDTPELREEFERAYLKSCQTTSW